jgi:uncharacterized membrane protein affecting hemolysin expression
MIEKAHGAASSAIEALKAQPIMLTLVLLQIIVIGSVLYSNSERQRANSVQFERLTTLVDRCLERQQ